MNDFQAPEVTTDFHEEPFSGSFQEVLAENIGKSVSIDFLIGTNNLINQNGRIYSVGKKYVILYKPVQNSYVLGDIYAIKFVTFLNPDLANTTKYR